LLLGLKPEFKGLEESLAIHAINRRAEADFLKVMSIVNAIISTGNSIVSAISKSGDTPSQDSLKNTLDALKSVLLPHLEEDDAKKKEDAKARLMAEMNKGPLKIQVMGKGKDKRKQRRS
jgi:hypothetical protein